MARGRRAAGLSGELAAATADRRADWLASPGAKGLPEAEAASLWDEAFWVGKLIGARNAVNAIADHGLAVGADLLMASFDADSALR